MICNELCSLSVVCNQQLWKILVTQHFVTWLLLTFNNIAVYTSCDKLYFYAAMVIRFRRSSNLKYYT